MKVSRCHNLMFTFYLKGNISCKIPPVEPMGATSLTCTFPEDISLSKKDFSVVHTTNNNRPGKILFEGCVLCDTILNDVLTISDCYFPC